MYAVSTQEKENKMTRLFCDFFAALVIVGAAFWFPWLFYILTGHYLSF